MCVAPVLLQKESPLETEAESQQELCPAVQQRVAKQICVLSSAFWIMWESRQSLGQQVMRVQVRRILDSLSFEAGMNVESLCQRRTRTTPETPL